MWEAYTCLVAYSIYMLYVNSKQSWCWTQGDIQRQRQKEMDRANSPQHTHYSHMLTAVDGMKIEDLIQDSTTAVTVIENNNNNNDMDICDNQKSKVGMKAQYNLFSEYFLVYWVVSEFWTLEIQAVYIECKSYHVESCLHVFLVFFKTQGR